MWIIPNLLHNFIEVIRLVDGDSIVTQHIFEEIKFFITRVWVISHDGRLFVEFHQLFSDEYVRQ